MNEIQIFKNPQFGEIRTAVNENGEPMFCLMDLCRALGLTNTTVVAQRLEEEEVTKLDLGGRTGLTNFITESGLYTVILRSDSTGAKPFRKWVTSEILPSIRKHGAYLTSETIEKVLMNPDTIIQLATELKNERFAKEIALRTLELQANEIKQAAPKVEYYDEVLQSESLIATNVIAKELGMSAISLNKILYQKKVIYNSAGTWVLYAKYQNKGYTGTKTHDYKDSLGNERTSIQTYWTEKGRKFIHEIIGVKIGNTRNEKKMEMQT